MNPAMKPKRSISQPDANTVTIHPIEANTRTLPYPLPVDLETDTAIESDTGMTLDTANA